MTTNKSPIKESLAVTASYHKNRRFKSEDMVLVKIRHLHEDGTTSTELKTFKNPRRPIYITKRRFKFKVKPETAKLSQVDKYMTTQSNMFNTAKKALSDENAMYNAKSMRDINNSPNIFWSSLSVESIVLEHMRVKKGMSSTNILPVVGVVDFEWDVQKNDQGEVTFGTYCSSNRSCMVISREHFKKTKYRSEEAFKRDYIKGFKEIVLPILDKYYARPEVAKSGQVVRKFVPEIIFSDNEFTVMRDTIQYANQDKIDFLTLWNGQSDITKAKQVVERYALPLHAIFGDTSIDKNYRNTFFKEGQKGSKLDANGHNKSVVLQHEWHTLQTTSQFTYVDMMSAYHINRTHLPLAPSPALDWCMDKELDFGKLMKDFGVDPKDKEAWHKHMSINHPLEYALYTSMDGIGPLLLEDKNFEISSSYFSGVSYSPSYEFVKNPMRLSTDVHYYALGVGLVICGVGSSMKTEIDALISPSRNITVTLNPSYNNIRMGSTILRGCNDLTFILPNSADGDLTSSYPVSQIQANGSRGTTLTEYSGIQGLARVEGCRHGYSVISGPHNNYTQAQSLLKMPSIGTLLKRVNKTKV